MYQLSTLANGLRLATVTMPHRASVALGIWVGVGGRHETAEQNGISHFIEHMLFKGTRSRSAREISEAVEGVGGYLNAFTSEEHTCFYARAHHERLPELFDVLFDMYLDSVFRPAEISKEREVIKEELAMYFDQPAQHVHELLNETAWPDQPLGRPLTGTPTTLDGLRRSHFLEHLATHYVASNTVIVAAGCVEHEPLRCSLQRVAKRLRLGSPLAPEPARTVQTRPQIRLHSKDTEQTQIAWGIRTCSRHDKRRFALRIFNVLLGENMSSRLFQSLREDHGLAYNIQSSPSSWDDAGDLVISAGLDTDRLEDAIRLIRKELLRLSSQRVGAAEFNRAKDYVLGQMDLSLEGTENHMMAIGEQILGYGRIYRPPELRRLLSAVTAAEVRQAARDFIQSDRMNLALVSPRKTVRGLESLLTI
ncbi:MAG: insulinase family protein [Pedosphaera sp.]|nr:insulinase family protein [Pedosphaera sp.]